MLLLSDLSDSQASCIEPFGQRLPKSARHQMVCRHNPVNILRLKKLKIRAPTLDVGYHFETTDPDFTYYKNQKVTAGFLASHHRAWCLNGLRSGKTHSSIAGREMLRDVGYHGRTLILSPENVVNEAWGDSYKMVNPDLEIYVSDGSVKDLQKHMVPEMDVIVLNHGKLPYCVIDIDKWDFDHLICDEGSLYRTMDKEPVQNMTFLTRNREVGDYVSERPNKRWLWNLTGTPRPRDATDVYPMATLINPRKMGMSFEQWRNLVQFKTDVRHPKTKQFMFRKWEDKRDSKLVDRLCAEHMRPSIRFRTEDCVDLPPQAYSYFPTPCQGDQKVLYNMIGRKGAGIGEDDSMYRVANTPNKINKMLQVASGTAVNTEGEWIHIGAKSRIDTFVELYHNADGKSIIFINFVESANYIANELKKRHIPCKIINRKTSKKKRELYRERFQTEKRKSVLIMHPETTRFGTTVSKASLTVWWVPPSHGEYWIQGNERARGPGTCKTLVAMFYSSEMERERYERVRNKGVRNNETVDMFGEFRKSRALSSTLEDQFMKNWSIED